MDKEISVVIPLLNEEKGLETLHARLKDVLESLARSYEIVFVDDGSEDDSWLVLERLHAKDKTVKAIQLGRNSGKAAALSAGFKNAKGKVVITMDADLQDDPEEIPNLIKKLEEGYDLIAGWRFKRADSLLKIVPSKIFNWLTSLSTGAKIHDFNCGLKASRRRVIRDIKLYGEMHRYIPALAHWKGYAISEIRVGHHPRAYGRSKFGPMRILRGMTDLLTVMFLTRYVERPLHLFGPIGSLLFLAGLVINIYLGILWFLGEGIGSRPLLLLGVMLMLIGFQIGSTGLIGEIIVGTREKDQANYFIKRILD